MSSNNTWPQSAAPPIENQICTSERLLFTSGDPEEIKSMVGRVMKPHQFTLLSPHQRLNARMHYIPMGDIALSRLKYGADVSIEPGQLQDFFLVQMPLSGSAWIESGGKNLESTPQMASLLSPEEATVMRWSSDSDQIMLRISRSLLERSLVGQLGSPLDKPLVFDLGFAWQRCIAWRTLMNYLIECATRTPDLLQYKLIASQIEQLVSVTLLSTHNHNYTEDTGLRRSIIRPRHVRRVQEYLQANAHEPITVEELSHIAGVSLRSLYAGFKEFLNTSPMQYLRELRMERVRAELLSGEATSVTGVALRWGFAHMGRFSAEYKQRYGETPSQSLKKT